MDYERERIIADLRRLQFNYKFDKYTTEQLKAIRGKSIEQRHKICQEISDLGRELGYGNKYNENNMFYSNLAIDKLKGILKRLYEKKKRRIISNQILDYAFGLEYNTPEYILQNMEQGPKTTEDLIYERDRLAKELHELLEEAEKRKDHGHNYDKDYAMGDDPILDESPEVRLPYEKTLELISIIEKIRKSGKSPYLRDIKRDRFKKMMSPYHELTKEKYEQLDEYDFTYLINLYNKSIYNLDLYEEIDENEYRHTM